MALSGFLSIVSFILLGKQFPRDFPVYIYYALLIPVPITFWNIFLYKHLRKQKKVQVLHLFLADIVMAALIVILVINNQMEIYYIMIVIVTVFASVFSGLAYAFILKDIRLLESVDRIR
jgi:peptidoglycan/LPS O-acetylase OafA/YrhL